MDTQSQHTVPHPKPNQKTTPQLSDNSNDQQEGLYRSKHTHATPVWAVWAPDRSRERWDGGAGVCGYGCAWRERSDHCCCWLPLPSPPPPCDRTLGLSIHSVRNAPVIHTAPGDTQLPAPAKLDPQTMQKRGDLALTLCA
jgi:hypothetical protein